jgi:hypothetical protein
LRCVLKVTSSDEKNTLTTNALSCITPIDFSQLVASFCIDGILAIPLNVVRLRPQAVASASLLRHFPSVYVWAPAFFTVLCFVLLKLAPVSAYNGLYTLRTLLHTYIITFFPSASSLYPPSAPFPCRLPGAPTHYQRIIIHVEHKHQRSLGPAPGRLL